MNWQDMVVGVVVVAAMAIAAIKIVGYIRHPHNKCGCCPHAGDKCPLHKDDCRKEH